MNKKIVTGMLIGLVAAGTVFAAGTGERPSDVEPGRRLTTDTTDVSVTGTVEYRDEYPVLVTDEGDFSLSARRGGLYSGDLEEGMVLTVTGEQIAALEESPSGADYHIFLESAEANGETVEFDQIGGRVAKRTASTNRGTRGNGNIARDGSGAGQGPVHASPSNRGNSRGGRR